jgi:hypothetical protein
MDMPRFFRQQKTWETRYVDLLIRRINVMQERLAGVRRYDGSPCFAVWAGQPGKNLGF